MSKLLSMSLANGSDPQGTLGAQTIILEHGIATPVGTNPVDLPAQLLALVFDLFGMATLTAYLDST